MEVALHRFPLYDVSRDHMKNVKVYVGDTDTTVPATVATDYSSCDQGPIDAIDGTFHLYQCSDPPPSGEYIFVDSVSSIQEIDVKIRDTDSEFGATFVGILLELGRGSAYTMSRAHVSVSAPPSLTDCSEISRFGLTLPGVYRIKDPVDNTKEVQVYCSQGWTYILSRTQSESSVNFHFLVEVLG